MFKGWKKKLDKTTKSRDRSSSASSSSSDEGSKRAAPGFELGVLRAHNELRERHDAAPLKLRSDLTKQATEWANKLASSGRMVHSQGTGFGENLAMTTKPDPTPEEIVKMWYDEIHDYDFRKAVFTSGTGHFTQVVWKGSTHLGVGVARGQGRTFVVANYDPPGNYRGQFAANVVRGRGPPPAKDASPSQPVRKVKHQRKKSSSSESSSSSDEGGKEEREVKTSVNEFVDDQGRKVRKTTKVTTTTTTVGNKRSTKTKTETHTEYLDDDRDARLIGEKIRAVKVGKEYDPKIKSYGSDGGKMTAKEVDKFESECVVKHNDYRRRHGVPSLTRSKELQRKAQKWAEHLAKTGKLQHSSGNDCGENIAYKFASDLRRFKGGDMVDMWYDEIKHYDFKRGSFSQTTGHFTQVVWADTKEIGVGVAYDGKGTCYCVANYLPHGNVQGKFAKNVKPLLF